MNEKLPRVLITGATGLVGKRMVECLHRPLITSRSQSKAEKTFGDQIEAVIEWDGCSPLEIEPDTAIDAVVHLMGEPIAEGRWNDAKKQRIADSRIDGTRFLVEGLRRLNTKPKMLVSASAVGIYGSQGDNELTEDANLGEGFLVDVCRRWEQAADAASDLGIRVCKVRVGLVLDRQGGVIGELLPTFRWGLGAKLGNGRQYFPWVHIEDLVRLFVFAIDRQIDGILNGAAPHPVTNGEFTKALAKALKRPAFLFAPKFALRLALGEFADSLFSSQRVIPKKALDAGFEFQFSKLDDALKDLLND